MELQVVAEQSRAISRSKLGNCARTRVLALRTALGLGARRGVSHRRRQAARTVHSQEEFGTLFIVGDLVCHAHQTVRKKRWPLARALANTWAAEDEGSAPSRMGPTSRQCLQEPRWPCRRCQTRWKAASWAQQARPPRRRRASGMGMRCWTADPKLAPWGPVHSSWRLSPRRGLP